VNFLLEMVRAILLVGIPVGVFTLVIVWWALRQGYFQETADIKALGLEIKAMSKKTDNTTHNPVQKKWAKFGGGFYGIVAFFTWLVIEVTEITGMIINFGGFFGFLKALDIGVIIDIFIEAISNFISAMIWPFYWMDRIDTGQTWLWFVVAYAGYWAGLKIAQVAYLRHPGRLNKEKKILK